MRTPVSCIFCDGLLTGRTFRPRVMDRTSSPLVLVVGDITADVMASLDTTPVTGGDCLASKLEFHSGGVGG
ncbi:MAG: hypothetical protein ACE5JX_22610, partial [Acidobacteriota bacterium]